MDFRRCVLRKTICPGPEIPHTHTKYPPTSVGVFFPPSAPWVYAPVAASCQVPGQVTAKAARGARGMQSGWSTERPVVPLCHWPDVSQAAKTKTHTPSNKTQAHKQHKHKQKTKAHST